MVQVVLIIGLMIIASIEDIRKKEISGWLLILLGAISVVYSGALIYKDFISILEVLIALLPGSVVLLLAFGTRQGIGYGDGLLLLAIGPAIGLRALLIGLCVAFFASGVLSIIMIIVKKVGRRFAFPFVPFMTIGMVVSCFAKI